ncbi:hypothetical protein AB1N83_004283 [Pleurotus pulmonarius]
MASAMKDALKADFTASSLSQDNTRGPTVPERGGEGTSDMRSVDSNSVSQPGHVWSSPTQKHSPLASVKSFLKADLSASSAKGVDKTPPFGTAQTANTPYEDNHNVQPDTTFSELSDRNFQSASQGSGDLQPGVTAIPNSHRETLVRGAGTTTASKTLPGRKTPPYGDVGTNSGVFHENIFAKVPSAETGQNTNDVTTVHTEFTGNGATDDLMPSGHLIEDTRQLEPVVHERIVSVEVEEIIREKHLERHVHHIQHHVVPIIHHEEGEEHLHHQVYPVSNVVEHHTGKPEDQALLESILKLSNTTTSEPTRRSTIENGTIVYENVHHHYHNIVQPVIEKMSSLGVNDDKSKFTSSERTNLSGFNESSGLRAGNVADNLLPCPKCHQHASNLGEDNVAQMD